MTEAAAWNPFLALFGLSFAQTYNGVSGNISVAGDPIFNGVGRHFHSNGNSISGTAVVCCGDLGLFAVVRSETPSPVPEPGTLVLLGLGLAGLGLSRRREAD